MKCKIEGCLADHPFSPFFQRIGCKCRGDFICAGHRYGMSSGHIFPKVAKEDEPSFCNTPRLTLCQYPYCDCGRQGG